MRQTGAEQVTSKGQVERMKTDYNKYKPAIVNGYTARGLSKAEAEKRASLTLRMAAILEQKMQNAGTPIRQRGGTI